MVYRRTHQVVKRLAARRSAILAAAREAAAEGGMAAVQIAPVAVRASESIMLDRGGIAVLRYSRRAAFKIAVTIVVSRLPTGSAHLSESVSPL